MYFREILVHTVYFIFSELSVRNRPWVGQLIDARFYRTFWQKSKQLERRHDGKRK